MKINNLTGKPNAGMYKDRGTGKSTALALSYIGQAIENPNEKIFIRDHYNSQRADEFLAKQVLEYIQKLGLQFIEYRRCDNSLKFNLYKESDEYVELNGKIYKEVVL